MKTILTDLDLHLFGEGNHYRIYEKLGAHAVTIDGVAGLHFAVWAPNARPRQRGGRLQPVGRPRHVCEPVGLVGHLGGVRARASATARSTSTRCGREAARSCSRPTRTPGASRCRRDRPRSRGTRRATSGATASGSPPGRRAATMLDRPVSVYEVHLGSWRRGLGNEPLTYRDLAEQLVPYVKEHGLHPRGAAAGDGAPVHRVVGLPGDGVLRADEPLRLARGLQVLRRRLPPGRHRRDPRLGARATSRRTATA